MVKEYEHQPMVAGASRLRAANSSTAVILFAADIEPFHDVLDTSACFEILEDGRNRHAGALEDPRAAHFPGNALHGGHCDQSRGIRFYVPILP